MSKKSDLAPTLRSWIVAGTLGTTLAFLFDGDRGVRRRARLKHHIGAFYHIVNRRVNERTETASGVVYDAARERLGMSERDNVNPDDNTLRDRIESEAFNHHTAPKGEYNLNVEDGIAVLRGQLDSQEDIQRLIRLVADVPDVLGVESYLHTPGTPAPNKESAIEASE